ncbi:MBL fold metallo-hydrolase [Nakamurella endophytica]|nr:MBL fold metallo-hydrolase [Nakamurella endophytica]
MTGSLQFIGNATVLIRFGDLTLLTDPNFLHQGQYAYLGLGMATRRLREPALSIAELPPLDGIVLSHLHGDHWDRAARRGLDRDLPVVTTHKAARRLRQRHFSHAVGLATWSDSVLVHGRTQARITALPGRHAPLPVHRLLPPVMGSMVELGPADGPPQVRLYISGDTLLVDELADIPRRFPHIDHGLFHLGGTRLPTGWSHGLMVTMDGRQGADLLELVRPATVTPIHHDDYTVFTSPLTAFTAEVGRRGLGDRVTYVEPGGTVELRGRATPPPTPPPGGGAPAPAG